MKKSIKLTFLVLMALGSSIFVFAETSSSAKSPSCQPGSAGLCEFEPFELKYECIIPPTPISMSDCSGTTEEEVDPILL